MSHTPLTRTPRTDRAEALQKASQLFHTLDPSPFRESDLDQEAEEYIVNWALELPKTSPIEIIIHLPWDEFSQSSASDLAGAIKGYFAHRADAMSSEMRELFQDRPPRSTCRTHRPFVLSRARLDHREHLEGRPSLPNPAGEFRHLRLGRNLASIEHLPLQLAAPGTSPKASPPPGRSNRNSRRRRPQPCLISSCSSGCPFVCHPSQTQKPQRCTRHKRCVKWPPRHKLRRFKACRS